MIVSVPYVHGIVFYHGASHLSFSTFVEPYPGMFFSPICLNDCGVVPYCAVIYRFVSMFVEPYPNMANYVHCELQDHCVVLWIMCVGGADHEYLKILIF